MYKQKPKRINWYLNGYQIAKGSKGTGWMIFSEYNAEELRKEGGWNSYTEMLSEESENTFLERLDEYIEGWKETLQWEYEVGDYMQPVIVNGEVNDKRQDQEGEWIQGYEKYAIQVLTKLAKKEKKKKKK